MGLLARARLREVLGPIPVMHVVCASCRMGTHPSGPAMLATDPTTSLQEWLEQHSQALGATVLERFGLKLPFLFKVLLLSLLYSVCHHFAMPVPMPTGSVSGNSFVHSVPP